MVLAQEGVHGLDLYVITFIIEFNVIQRKMLVRSRTRDDFSSLLGTLYTFYYGLLRPLLCPLMLQNIAFDVVLIKF